MSTVISLVNQKGGVGKTTATVNVGAALARKGENILLVDFDPQANLSSYVGFEKNERTTITDIVDFSITTGFAKKEHFAGNEDAQKVKEQAEKIIKNSICHSGLEKFDYIPSDILLAGAEQALLVSQNREQVLEAILSYVKNDYDYILIDCPPSLSILSINALMASDEIIVPVQAQNFALDGLAQLIKTYKKLRQGANTKLKIRGFIITMATQTTQTKNVSAILRETFAGLVYQESISYSTTAADSTADQKSLVALAEELDWDTTTKKNERLTKLGIQFMNIADEILSQEAP